MIREFGGGELSLSMPSRLFSCLLRPYLFTLALFVSIKLYFFAVRVSLSNCMSKYLVGKVCETDDLAMGKQHLEEDEGVCSFALGISQSSSVWI